MSKRSEASEQLVIQRSQLILAQKRTSLATLRTGIAVFAIPLSVLSVLIATSKYYEALEVLHLIVPLLVLSCCLALLGIYLIVRAMVRIKSHDTLLEETAGAYKNLANIVK